MIKFSIQQKRMLFGQNVRHFGYKEGYSHFFLAPKV